MDGSNQDETPEETEQCQKHETLEIQEAQMNLGKEKCNKPKALETEEQKAKRLEKRRKIMINRKKQSQKKRKLRYWKGEEKDTKRRKKSVRNMKHLRCWQPV